MLRDNADYRDPVARFVLIVVKAEALADRVLIRPEVRGAFARDNRRFVVGRAVSFVEVAAQQQRQIESRQNSRATAPRTTPEDGSP